MGDEALKGIFAIATAIIGIAIVAVVVSNSSNTSGVIKSAASGLASDIQAAVAPVSGSGTGLGSLSSLTSGLNNL